MHALPTRNPLTLACAFLACLLDPSMAFGQASCTADAWDQAVERAQHARGYADAKEYDKALVELMVAYQMCPDGKLKRAIARVLEDAGRLPEALEANRQCAEETSEEKTWAECTLRAQVLSSRLSTGTLLVVADPSEALVFIDEGPDPRPAGVPISMKSGRHQVEVRAAGRLTESREVDVPEGADVRVEVTLQPQATHRLPRGTSLEPRRPLDLTTPAVASTRRPSSAWNWVGVGLGTAATGVGVAFLIQYGIDKGNARGAQYAPDGKLLVAADVVGSRNVIVGSILSAVGVAGVITSAVLWPRAPAKVTLAPLRGGGAVAFEIPL